MRCFIDRIPVPEVHLVLLLVFFIGCRTAGPPQAETPAEAQAAAAEGAPDSDGDGIPDDQDQCPDQAEVFNGYLDEDGCGDCVLPVPKNEIVINAKIYFPVDAWEIQPVSEQVLDAVAGTLLSVPEITLVKISGHVDASDTPGHQDLSSLRAKAVKDYLVEKGVEAERLEIFGAGDTQPAPAQDGYDQAELNRRVDFEIIAFKE